MAKGGCQPYTGGSCSILNCKAWRNAVCSRDHKCECLAGTCALDGKCETTCSIDAKGSCRLFGCSSSRGATDCISGHCYCQAGTCLDNEGVCIALETAPTFLAEDLALYRNMSLAQVKNAVQAAEAEDRQLITIGSLVGGVCALLIAATMRAVRVWRVSQGDKNVPLLQ